MGLRDCDSHRIWGPDIENSSCLVTPISGNFQMSLKARGTLGTSHIMGLGFSVYGRI